jgi:hypothetical protein
MPKFDASSVSDIEYDFTGWNGIRGSAYEGRPIDDKGSVPEPSRQMVSQTMTRVANAFKALDMDEVEETPEGIAQAMEKVSDEETFDRLGDELMATVSELCDGHPRRESLEALGWRKFMAFFGYVMGEMMSPEVEGIASRTTPKRLRSV